MDERQLAELAAAKAIAVSFLCEGINILDAAHEAQRHLGWKPSYENTTLIMKELAAGQVQQREQIYRDLRERFPQSNDPT